MAFSAWVPVLAAALILHSEARQGSQNKEKQLPNIIIITADDLGWNDVSFHGSNQIPTPNIDALAYNGVILNSHYVPALCSPSRASLLTGKYPTTTGMQHLVILADQPWGLPLTETLMPSHFKKHGYATHAIGKWHLGYHQTAYTPTCRGFDSFFGYWNGYQDYYDHTMEGSDQVVEPVRGYDMRRDLEVDYTSLGRYSTDVFTEEAVKLIAQHNQTQGPLFLYFAHLAPHSGNNDKPYQAPDEEIAQNLHISDPQRRVYASMVTSMDKSVGRVVAALRHAALLDNSIIVFMADNGAPTFGNHCNKGSNFPLKGLKETPWEGGIRGVAAVWSPLLSNTQRVYNELMHVSDWLPTLYSAAGLSVSELGNIDGKDMWHVLSNNLRSPRSEVFNNYDEVDNYSSLRIEDWKHVAGTTLNGKGDGWYGDTGLDATDLGYDVGKVLQSDSNKAITGFLTNQQLKYYGTDKEDELPDIIKPEIITNLRKQSTLQCNIATNIPTPTQGTKLSRKRRYATAVLPTVDAQDFNHTVTNQQATGILICNPTKSPCLFNLHLDPCERYNLAGIYPDVLKHMGDRLAELKRSVAKPLNKPGDPSGHPVNHNNTWVSWCDAEDTKTCGISM